MTRPADAKAMRGRWVTAADLLALGCPALPTDQRALGRYIERHGWRDTDKARPREGRGGGWEYHYSILPPETQATLLAADAREGDDGPREDLWRNYEALPETAKNTARARLAAVTQIAELLAGGMDATTAVALVAKRSKVSTSTLWNWRGLVEGLPRSDWEPALAPRHQGRTKTAKCDPRAWEFLKADYLRPEQPSFIACYRRLQDAAAEHDWSPIPSAKTLQRRLEREVPRGARTLARGGRDSAAQVFPHQTRDRSVFHAMQAVNADGHRFDVFVRWEDGEIGRPVMVAIQDLHSGMIVGHRIDRTENWSAVRHAFADMMESFGIPERVWFDNGRSFASKWLTGGSKNRFRFKIKDDEPEGLLTRLGVKVHWTTPYHGQAKPIERAFRDMCEEIAKHPACAGAYTGNKPDAKPENYNSKAMPIDDFRALVADEIRRHNTREGRRSALARGRSFAQVFKASMEAPATMVTRATAAQLRLFLMAAEGVSARKPTGEIQLAGNRYWAEPLADHIGEKLVVRFDPQALIAGVSVYSRDGRFICDAACIAATGFDDIDAARDHARRKRLWLKRQRECLELERRMTIDEVAALLPAAEAIEHPEQPRVVKLAVNAPAPPRTEDSTAEESFGRAIRSIAGDRDVVRFPRNEGGTDS